MKSLKPYADLSSWSKNRARSLVLVSAGLLAFAFLALILIGQPLRASSAAVGELPGSKTELPPLRGEEAIAHLQTQGLYSSLQEAMQAARYGPQWVTGTGITGMDGAYQMNNPANHLRAYVSASEMRVLQMTDEGQQSWQLGMKLANYGHGDNLSPVGDGEVKVAGNRVEIRRSAVGNPQSAIVEWYENSARGLEQGFEIDARPESAIGNPKSALNNEPLRLVFELSGSLKAQLDETRQQVGFSDGRTLLVYEKLTAWDANGQRLDSHMELDKGQLSLVVRDEGAEYPLRIDPLLREQIRVTASDGAASDQFGISVAISGDTAVVGAFRDIVGANAEQGSAYVFVRSGATWTQQAQITASDGAADDEFGESVAISGDTVVVGADDDDVGANANQGSAYVFVRSATTWTQQAKITASNGVAADQFGVPVDISGDTVVVGVRQRDVGSIVNQGSAYVFVRSGTTWTEQAQLTASDGATSDEFGVSVAISEHTVLVAAANDDVVFSNQGSAYVFVRSGAIWTQEAKLTASDGAIDDAFGHSVAISGDTVVVGVQFDDVAFTTQGSAYVFVRSGTTWTQQQKLTASDAAAGDRFGNSVAISGETVVVGAFINNGQQGSAYVFTRNGTTWTQEPVQLTASDAATPDLFGNSVAISGDTVVVGAPLNDVGQGFAQGSAYIFICNWNQQQQLTASDGLGSDEFGQSVSISGDTVVVGAFFDDVGANGNQGSAYVFVRTGTLWTEQAKLLASDGAANDQFAESVAISGDTVVVGAHDDDVGANANQGSAYVFVRVGVTWTQQTQLTASDGALNDSLGSAVSISGDTIVVGAEGDDTSRGSAYVFVRSGAIWTQQQKLTASDGAASDEFGVSVTLSGDTLVVGADRDDVVATNQGSAYVFVRNGANWSQQQKLTASDGLASDEFGTSVAISGDTVVVGAVFDDVVASNQGSAYVFGRSGTTWTQQAQLAASDGAVNDQFGQAVTISGDTVVVGAFGDTVGASAGQGSAYVFVRSAVGWTERQRLTASDGATSDNFGNAVAISGDTVVVGAFVDNVGANSNQGSAYVFFTGCNTAPALAARNQIRQKGSIATSTTIGTVEDGQDPIGYLTVSVVSAPTGISVTNLTNSNGVISAQVAALCNATLGNNSVVLRVLDSDGATGDVTLYVNVTANSDPVLGAYPDASVLASNATAVAPSVAPSDNGSIVEIVVTSPTYSGGLSVNSDSGIVSISNARPAGTHIITVTAIDNCGSSASQAFLLTVTCQSITVNPSSLFAGTAGSFYSQTFAQSGGIAPITFSLSGTLPTGMSFTAGTAALSGTPTQVGSFPITVTATDRNNCTGSRNYTLVIGASMLVWNGNTSSDWNTAANWTPNAVPTTFNDVLIPTAGVTNQPTISAASSSINAMTIQASRVLTINSGLQLSTAADVTSVGTITGAGTLTFAGTTFTQNGSVSVASAEFTAGSHSLTGGGAFASGIVTALSGAAVTLTSNHSISVLVINSGGSFDATGRTLTLTGAGTAIFNSGTFTATGSTLVYQGSVSQVVTANISYSGLTINNAAGVSLAGDTTVNGLLNLTTDLTTGSLTLTMPASGSSTGAGDVIGNVKRTGYTNGAALSFGNPLNMIRFDSGTPPSDVTVNLVKSAPAGFPANTVTRTYTITPNGGSGFSATLRARYKDAELNGLSESTLELWRFNGSTWVSPAGTATRDASQNFVEETGITAFSPWAISGPTGPTEVKLISFEATGYDNGVMLEWKTGFEVDNLGFRVYRDEGGVRSLLNREIVAGSALTAGSGTALTAGRDYAFWVGAKETGRDSAFWLEDIDLKGNSTWHGPFATKQVGGKPAARSLAESLSQVGQARANESTHFAESFATLARPAQSTSSPISLQQTSLASSRAVKIGVKQAGWYRVTQAELIAAGLDPKADPRTLRLFVDGIEIAIFVAGDDDGRLDANDSVEFYGLGLNTPSTDTRVYWLVSGSKPGLRINKTPFAKGYPSGESFPYTVERRDRTIYFSALKNGDEENFFGAVVSSSAINQRLTLNNLGESTRENAEIEVSLQGVTNLAHHINVSLNGSSIAQILFSGQSKGQQKIQVPQALLREGENVVTLQSINGPSDISLVVFIRVTYHHSFKAENDSLSFTAKSGETTSISDFSSKDIRVFDVTDEGNVQELAVSIDQTRNGFSATVSASGVGERKLLALTEGKALRASNVKANTPSHLRDASNVADFIIIGGARLTGSLKPLVDLRSKQGLVTELVDIEDVYDEFSFGEKSPQAVRDFLAFARGNWKLAPRFVLFAGDASFDPRNYLEAGDFDLVPTKLIDTTYLETASDDWFADFNDDGLAEISVGRLPVRTAEEASVLVTKLIAYEQSAPSNEVALVADSNDGFDFERTATMLRGLMPSGLRVAEIFRAHTDDSTARNQVLAAINRGQKIVNYTGHGSANVWRGNLLTSSDASLFINRDRLSLFVMMTCLNGYFQDAMNESLGESLLKSENGGAVAVWASSGMTLPQEQGSMNEELYRLLFSPKSRDLSLGEIMRRAKATVKDSDIRRTWILLGDPTIKVK